MIHHPSSTGQYANSQKRVLSYSFRKIHDMDDVRHFKHQRCGNVASSKQLYQPE
jgi:hypothetical protein